MKLIYEGTDITADVNIISAKIKDNASGVADSLEIIFSDTEKLWRQWNPQKGDKIELQADGFSSGLMYVDEPGLSRGKFSIRALSTPLTAKTPRSKSWENVRFKKMAQDMAQGIGLAFETYDIADPLYDRLDQIDKANLEFLNERCILEGYCLKITDGKVVIYDERKLEQESPVLTITPDMLIGDYEFFSISSGLYSSCLILYLSNTDRLIKYQFTPSNAPAGPILRPKIRASNQGEAERFAKGLLRAANKYETQGRGFIRLNTSIAAGNVVQVSGMGAFDGSYFLESVIHNLTGGKSFLNMRKVLEGY
ncbi:MAG TPA: hypothetical protein GXX35_11530 [Thermoanaerobacterales bacterium]|nr:hypothetical protein [Thermoanaerobacterales bacterium]